MDAQDVGCIPPSATQVRFLSLSAAIVQRLERQPSKLVMQVRFLLVALKKTLVGGGRPGCSKHPALCNAGSIPVGVSIGTEY